MACEREQGEGGVGWGCMYVVGGVGERYCLSGVKQCEGGGLVVDKFVL